MHYVISDVHGDWKRYKKMLDKILFTEEDALYVLGDVVDRGDDGVKILFDMMNRPNVIPLLGNHEFMMVYCSKYLLFQELTEQFTNELEQDLELIQSLVEWMDVGGSATITEMKQLSKEERKDVLEYLEDFLLWEEITVEGKKFVLVHAGLDNFLSEKSLDSYHLKELIFESPRYDEKYFDDKYLVTGHLPTRVIRNSYNNLFNEEKDKSKDSIIIMNNHIAIDCACGYDGRLGCLCLETFEEFYV